MDTNEDGTYNTMVGDTIDVTTIQTINFGIKVYNATSSDHIRIFTKAGWVDPGNPNIGDTNWLPAGSGNPWTYVFSKTFTANEQTFVRVELRQSWLTNYSMDGMTNPIYINIH
ncbi:hypothetical protein [Acididesulfobacillus acetoxydans]|uniref:hypothetical protein n=1 Tax=Acididesulfobacillus acetoxydans TaxID=1561005 RepID=UPI001F1152E2|nr:hypothetical protein [Acididesulfobacillus acetoxydans]